MTFSDTEMMELDRKHPTNIHNTRSLIRTLKYVLDNLQTEEALTVEEYKHTHTYTTAANARSVFLIFFMKSKGTCPCILLFF